MPKVQPEVEAFARIKVIGIGGSGKNAVNHMINSKVKGVEFIVMNTDAQDLHHSLAQKKIHIGKNLTRGLGTGMNPEIGRKAAEETKEEVQGVLKGADMVFIAGGMGGGTGTGAAPVVASIAKEQGALTIGVVTRPFTFEGSHRGRLAEQGLDELRKQVDALIIVPNDRILSVADKDTTFKSAFTMSDEVLRQAVEGISDLITTPGIINVDFADIRSVLSNAGSALLGIGSSSGENRAQEAALAAINSPLLDLSISGAKGVLFAIAGGADLRMHEINEAAKIITESIDPDARVIFGAILDDKLKKNELKITVIAAGFPEGVEKRALNSFATKTQSVQREENRDRTVEKREINNSFVEQEPKKVEVSRESTKTALDKEPVAVIDLEAEGAEDWSAVPAFLRRPKKNINRDEQQ
ncbi:MAG: cell division protein FtsZ [Candidatus Yonathbacteria bacterium RIFCSPHIGHO2_01_FULL_44_41]|uniref:Cell division protein FtsZ n=1 Tax=Candidatus Yonathbacteria bacterium RIFCSPHIGHO2_02_FULL_44_14 TaxID=1802724 RepID=A0A1G2S8B4_9BACT|nr:MAG: cell division protein FtsZ [Candidatus Yonathbacteria bacterium RIFCSPHIGHO2_01_FULL_44_41]OHA80929.1 MAG: cell division protein FtsZ [Candidatus Yonathbacteria bacterium RIFCSPHIGHO2_02_FULL_44_14]OHA82362.1 MAG: cell division protein FtsZ [Candidatus Yonathbacteria bacterium RIFCSPLOWO2_01_FULL_43_20]